MIKALRQRIAYTEKDRDMYKKWCNGAPLKGTSYSPNSQKGAEFDAILLQGKVERIHGELESKAQMSRLRGEGSF